MDDGIDGESLHQPAKLFRGEHPQIPGSPWPGKAAALHPLIKEEEAVTFPEQAFDLRSGLPAEKEQGVRDEQLFMELPFNDRCKGIDAVPEIGKAADDVNTGKRPGISIFKHSAPPG